MSVNEILKDAGGIAGQLQTGVPALKTLDKRIGELASKALLERAERIKAYHRGSLPSTADRVDEPLTALIRSLAFDGDEPVSADTFGDRVSQSMAGIVLTAHPTFALSKEGWKALTSALNEDKIVDTSGPLNLLPASSPTLDDELEYANRAIDSIRLALRNIWRAVFLVGTEIYPQEWHRFTPTLFTVASWVGFDLDGRTDIGWSKSLHFRYKMTLEGLARLRGFWAEISAQEGVEGHLDAEQVSQTLSALEETYKLGFEKLRYAVEENEFAGFNRLAISRRTLKEEARHTINACLDQLVAGGLSSAVRREIAVFRSEWQTIGLGLSHIHFRLNAAQLHNAVRPLIDLKDAPDRSASRRHYLDAIASLLDGVKPEAIHYGSVAEEQTTARRVFMLAAQFRKHFDDNSPLRMLVAESDTPFTLLTALYYAKLFDVDDYVEISPLFETAVGLQRGDRVIKELLDNAHFLEYIQTQGRFCVQLGFSDSGRYIGQLAATLAIERFKLRLIRLWEARGLKDIQLVFFDTHGESMGRGAHPDSLRDRFLYTHTPEVRGHLDRINNAYKHEVSFQGGDGYRHFLNQSITEATVTALLSARLERYGVGQDALYENSDWSLDFFLTLTEVQEELVADKGYVRLVDSIGQAMLYPTGSRAV